MSPRPDAAVLALDQGTTGSTAFVFGPEGEVLGRAYAEITQHYPSPGWVEHDAEEIWQKTRRVAAEAVAASGIAPGALRAIGITNQRETTVLWDRKTGDPVYRAIVWQSRQTAEICARLKAEGHEPVFHERTGLVLDPYFSGSKIAWLLEGNPALRARAEAGEIAFGTIDSWLIHRLTGGRVHATDPTNASRTLLFDIHSRRWDPELLRILGVPAAMLPEVRPSSGRLRGDGGLRRDSRGGPDRRGRGRPAGRALRPGLLRARHGEEHLRHRRLPRAQHGRPPGDQPPRPPDDALLRRPRGRRLRPRGLGLRGRRRRAVAARRDGPRAHRGGDGPDRRERAGHPGRLRRAGLHRPRRALLGRRGARRDPGAHPRGGARPPRPRDAREPRLPEPRRHRRDERGVRRAAARAAGGRRRLRQRLPDAVPGRHPRRAGGPAGPRRDDRGGRGVPGGPRGRALEGRGVARRPKAARSPLHAVDAAGAARGALLRLEGRRRARPQPGSRGAELSRSPPPRAARRSG